MMLVLKMVHQRHLLLLTLCFFFSPHLPSRERVTALLLIFKSRASWPSRHDRPDTNRQSDANVTSSQNVISHTLLVPWHFWRVRRGYALGIVDSNQTISSFQAKTKKKRKIKRKSNIAKLSIRNCVTSEPVMLLLPLGDTPSPPFPLKACTYCFVGKAVVYILTEVWLMHNVSPYELQRRPRFAAKD